MVKPINFENADIGFRNFEGREGLYNKKGEMSFAIFLDDQRAQELSAEGWNVKFPKVRDNFDGEEDNRRAYMQVSVGFDYYPPKMVMIAGETPTLLAQEEVGMLDWAEFEKIDLVVRPYEWSVNGNRGIKAYLKSGYFTLVTDQFASKYGI